MLLYLQRYDLTLKYVKGKFLHVADMLSRAHCNDSLFEDLDSAEVEVAIYTVFKGLPVSETILQDLRLATANDSHLQQLKGLID